MNSQDPGYGLFLSEFLGKNLVQIPEDVQAASLSEAEGDQPAAEEPPQAPPALEIPKLPQYGSFAKKLLLLTDRKSDSFPHPADKAFLDKFLTAIHCTWKDVTLLQIAELQSNAALLEASVEEFDYRFLIAFVNRTKTKLKLPTHTAYQAEKIDGKWFLLSDGIEELEGDASKTLKTKLWNAVKNFMQEL